MGLPPLRPPRGRAMMTPSTWHLMLRMSTSGFRTKGLGVARAKAQAKREGAYHHGDLRNALLAAGRALLAEGGTPALSLREAARRAGVSHAAPYRHFASREALLAAIAEGGFVALAAELERAA